MNDLELSVPMSFIMQFCNEARQPVAALKWKPQVTARLWNYVFYFNESWCLEACVCWEESGLLRATSLSHGDYERWLGCSFTGTWRIMGSRRAVVSVICIIMVPEINTLHLLSRMCFVRVGQAFLSAPPPPTNLVLGASCQNSRYRVFFVSSWKYLCSAAEVFSRFPRDYLSPPLW